MGVRDRPTTARLPETERLRQTKASIFSYPASFLLALLRQPAEIEENKDGKKKRNEELIAKYLTGPRDELLKSKLPNLETIAKKNKSKKEDYIKAFKPFIEDAEKLVIWDKKRRGLISPPQKGGGKSATDIKKATFDELRNINLNELIKYFNKKKVTSKDLFKGEVDLIPFDEKKGKKVIPLHITVKLNLYKKDCSMLNKLKEKCEQNRN